MTPLQEEGPIRSGFISISGRPNVGKSTLLNNLVGQKLAIISPKPQTTRKKLLGIVNQPGAQLIFVDSPGILAPGSLINRLLVKEALAIKDEADVVLFIAEAHLRPTEGDRYVLNTFAEVKAPVILVLNKVDLAGADTMPLYGALRAFADRVGISALSGENVPALIDKVIALLPEGPQYYPEDAVTDEIERNLAAEIIREKYFVLTGEEIPYAIAVTVEEFAKREGKDLTFVSATVHVERESQKGIVIGSGGQLLKRVGELARRDIEEMIGEKVFLKLWVKVAKNWRKDPAALRRFGFS